jgi:hypothetical protein
MQEINLITNLLHVVINGNKNVRLMVLSLRDSTQVSKGPKNSHKTISKMDCLKQLVHDATYARLTPQHRKTFNSCSFPGTEDI